MSMTRPRHEEDSRLHALTWQIGLRAAALVIGCVLVTAGALVAVYIHQTNTETNALLASAATRITDPATAPLGTYLAIEVNGSVRTTPGMPVGLPDTGALTAVRATGGSVERIDDFDPAGAYYVIRTSRIGDRVVQVVLDQTQVEEGRERLVRALLIAGAIGLVLAAVSAVVLARRAVRPLATTIRLQRRFVADASHELRTPVTLLSTRAQLLARRVRRSDVEPGVVRDAEGLVADVTVLTEILDDLLMATDLREDRQREPVDVRRLARAVAEAATSHAEALGIRLERPGEVGESEPATVAGHPVALRRAVTALVDNALEHGRSQVTVAVSVTAKEVVVAVSDDGPGIPADQVSRVFERFHGGGRSAEATARPGRRHYGLGLALVAEVVAVHGGTVRAGSRPGHRDGALVMFRLPRYPLI
ncbi:HAMP domain-containing sensor histidine kinase [Lapillicoccus sp.]|uniref:sensor histidine kinase n=1 Tax=Lapillicoccus sp. TaxID=1909287 RepID=UPI0025FFB2E8|nr:HAMP domain-containing sensor histidine kinase [Lapillicoccus sp.]